MIRVLIVEDDLSTGALLSQLIKRLWPQATVLLESTAIAAIEQCKVADMDLVLLDWGLPGMSGIEVLKHIRRSGKKTVCVIVSGRADREGIMDARAYQADAYIVKPFNAKAVMAKLSQIMVLPSDQHDVDERFASIEDYLDDQLQQGRLGLPIDPDLVESIEHIRELDRKDRIDVLRRCQVDPAIVFRLLSLANSSQYIRDMDTVETFEAAIPRVGLDGLSNLVVELSLHPGSTLKEDFLKARCQSLRRDCICLADIVTRLSADVEFDVKSSRAACMLYRVGESCLLQLLQSWADQGNELDELEVDPLLRKYSARLGNTIKARWNLPNTIRGRIGAAYLLPTGTVRKELLVMRIAGLLYEGDEQDELPRLAARIGLSENKLEYYRTLESEIEKGFD